MIFGILSQIMWGTRTQLYKTHNNGKTGKNWIPGDVMTSKAIHSTVSEVMRPFFILLAQTPESFHERYWNSPVLAPKIALQVLLAPFNNKIYSVFSSVIHSVV